MDADQLGRRQLRHLVGDERTPIAALGREPAVPEALHQLDPGPRHARGPPTGRRGLAGKSVAGHRRDHDVESVRRAAAVRRGVGQRIDDLQLLDGRARPAVGYDDRQRILMLRADMDEVDVEPVDLGHEVRQRVEPRFAPPPVIVRRPIARDLPHKRELHALGAVIDQLTFRPSRSLDATLEVGELVIGGAERERADRFVAILRRRRHDQQVFGFGRVGWGWGVPARGSGLGRALEWSYRRP